MTQTGSAAGSPTRGDSPLRLRWHGLAPDGERRASLAMCLAVHGVTVSADDGDAECPAIVLDCGTVMPELSGSEFFGHERGAFTNAHAARDGALALANRGSLFLDEIGELPPAMQAQFLRVVQEKTFKRLGSNTWQRTGFRLVCATNRDLERDAQAGTFRRDLYHRLAGWVFRIRALRSGARTSCLSPAFPGGAACLDGPAEIAPAVGAWLQSRDYPGNIRELRQLTLRIGHRHVGGGPIGLADIPEDDRPEAAAELSWPGPDFEAAIRRAALLGLGLREISRAASELAVRTAVQSHGSLKDAARSLGVTDRALQLRQASTRGSMALLN